MSRWLFFPSPAASEDLICTNIWVRTITGGTENTLQSDASSTVYNGWTVGQMFFRDILKNGVWTNDGLGLLWNMYNATDYARWTGYIGTAGGTFNVYQTGTTNLIYSMAWTGQYLWTTNTQRYGATSITFTGTVPGNNSRADIYHVKA